MAHAIRIHKTGGPEVLQWEEVAVPQPGPNEALIRHKAVGLNYIDTYHRSGLYAVPMPSGLGTEAAGVVEAVGSAVTEFKVGDRVAYANGPLGAYSELKVHPGDRLVKIPDGISFEQAASMMLQGLTVQYLIRRMHYVPKAGDNILWHAAAGGIGLIACQWAKALGVNLIGTVSTEEKAALAREHGAAHEVARLPAAARPHGDLRKFFRADAAHRRRHPEHQGIALRDAALAEWLRVEARRIARLGQGSLRYGPVRQGEDQPAPDLCAEGCRQGAQRPRGAQDHGLDRPHTLRPTSR